MGVFTKKSGAKSLNVGKNRVGFWDNLKLAFNNLVNRAGDVIENISRAWGLDIEQVSKALDIDAGERLTMDDLNKVLDSVLTKAGDLSKLGSQVESQLYNLQRLSNNPNIRSKIEAHIKKLQSKADDIKNLQSTVESQLIDAKNQAANDYSSLTQAGKLIKDGVKSRGSQLLDRVNDFAGSVEQRIQDIKNKYEEK